MNKTLLLLLFVIFSCSNDKLKIEPISSQLNMELSTGKNLDPNFFSTNSIFQYYQVSNYNNLSNNNLLIELESFVKNKYPNQEIEKHDNISILFYKKRILMNYDVNTIYESARDNEMGSIYGYENNLVSKILYCKENSKKEKTFIRIMYNKHNVVLSKEDIIKLD